MIDPIRTDLRGYFDRTWYVARHGAGKPWVRWRPWQYYRRRGRKKGHSPGPLFDAAWYLHSYADVRNAGLDPLAHYVSHGWREGRQPHPVFDPSWYRHRHPEVDASGHEPLLHYISVGWRKGLSPHPAFDAAGYLACHPDVAAAGLEPLAHYLTYGWREGRNPHPLFDVQWYLEANPDVALAELEPLGHFLAAGWREGRQASPWFCAERYSRGDLGGQADANPFVRFLVTDYEPLSGDVVKRAAMVASVMPSPTTAPDVANDQPVRAIAMYLPQFHRVPENDRWWGEGFTEWTNVRRARPMFAGHRQPRAPHPDVGYYDLLDATAFERQVTMARQYGIHGFCLYHYWFNGRRILERPVERLLASGRPDFPFCLCWANENWTRAWDGRDEQVLLEQWHSPESDERYLVDLLPALHDPRYIRVGDRPLVIVYRPALLAAGTADRWRRVAERSGLSGLFLATVHSFDQADPRIYGFDAAIQFPPLQTPAEPIPLRRIRGRSWRFEGGVLDYREAVRQAVSRPRPDYPLFRGVMTGWDNTPRRMERATVWVNDTPELYGRWLRATVERTRREQPPERRLVFINAWNEWGEGAHLEPDTARGYHLLEETAAALALTSTGSAVRQVA